MSDDSHTSHEQEHLEKIGRATAKIHHLLKEQGHLTGLKQSAATMPDARERLSYIDQTMHEASEKALSSVEASLPLIDQNRHLCDSLSRQLSDDPTLAQHPLIQETVSRLGEIAAADEQIRHQLMLIMEAQEFRDVAGQMVHKLTNAAIEIEAILLELLREYAPDSKDSLISKQSLTAGPSLKSDTSDVKGQDEADELLASLGF